MRAQLRLVGIILVSALVVACSAQPKQTAPVEASPAPAAASAAKPASTAATATATTAAVNADLVRKGYVPLQRGERLLYCRTEQITGTNFKRKLCLSEAELIDMERKTKEMSDEMRKSRTNPACATQTCG